MGITKTQLFTERQNRVAQLAKALAHPARIAILEHLIAKQGCVCGDIVEELPLSQSTVSQHLKAMKAAGIIKGSMDGVYTCYCVDKKCCVELSDTIKLLFGKLSGCC